ncbi:hypothetical protein H4R18_004983 [Coemansia javaensis]|uniref:chitin synthase n=1 Tax=Coemansia javaensis TaxID=2761396 RepID=A0A9W8H4J9_9FUNG|nr:hypothetical protein H4R18_004983 [Coemansia javaensis]
MAGNGGDGFDGIYGAGDGLFGLADHSAGGGAAAAAAAAGATQGVELEVLSNSSSNTRHDHAQHQQLLRDRLDHRTASDISSQAGGQPDRPLISGEPLIQGISEVPMPAAAAAPPPGDDGRFLQRRRRRQADAAGDEEADAGAGAGGGYESYRPPHRSRSLVRPERAQGRGVERQRALSRSSGSRRPRAAASAPRNRRRQQQQAQTQPAQQAQQTQRAKGGRRCCSSPWLAYCRVVTFWAPGGVLKCFGMADPRVQLAWREKMGLVSIILVIMAIIAFLTFGLQQVLCGLSGTQTRIKWNEVDSGHVVVNGRAYSILSFKHGPATPWTGAANSNIMGAPANAGGRDLSFLFQNPNGACRGIMAYDKAALDRNGNIVNVFPCVYVDASGSADPDQIPNNQGCHNTDRGRRALAALDNSPVKYTWDDVQRQPNLAVFKGAVLDLGRSSLLLDTVTMPKEMQALVNGSTPARGKDISLRLSSGRMKQIGNCMVDLFSVGSIDSSSMGCIASNIILYVSLIVILGTVLAKFFMAVYFGWFMGPRLGQVKQYTPEARRTRMAAIEAWADDNNHYGKEKLERRYTVMGHHHHHHHDTAGRAANRKSRFFPTTSRYSHFMPGDEPGARDKPRPTSAAVVGHRRPPRPASSMVPRQSAFFSDRRASHYSTSQVPTPGGSAVGIADIPVPVPPLPRAATPTTPAPESPGDALLPQQDHHSHSRALTPAPAAAPAPAPAPAQWNFEPAYTLLLVTCYSEGSHGIRTTLDSLCGTDYPASHKCLFIICDGLIKGAGEDMYTPDVCLSMMTDFVIPPDRVQPYTYVSIAQGAKRHNMAKLYAGYYAPSEKSPLHARENRVPMVLVVKCGTPEEASDPKPGNRGKRDSQIVLMSFLQRVMFDERMSELEYEMFNAMWNVTGVTPDNFEIVLMVDADTKVYVDSVTAMVKTMVDDPTIMGLCGETKIANKTDSWVTMIQVFEYYIAHHQSKAFESVFGGVTCLPGCFCMYRIKAPKGQHGYWVPILANPDIVEHYSENVVETLHDKNLLLLGEDRYLSTLMLRTFPKRKMMFVPSAVCKTIVPDGFKVLLSQRRRWINSTVHNLMELVLVNDLCGTFCLSMQFMIFMDLVGTVALPAAIVFTLYIIVLSTFTRPVPWLPLALLAAILGLPAVLIGLTSRKLVYIGWMLIYLLSLPVWNFVLPTYAYWHFDDFSWGQTRMVQGEAKGGAGGHGDKSGEFDSTQIVMKRWCDFEAEKRRKTQAILGLAALALAGGGGGTATTGHGSAADVRSLATRPSRLMVASRPVSVVNSGESPQLGPADSDEHLVVASVGQAAALHHAAAAAEDPDAQAAAGSIERLGYMTPNIIPVLASQSAHRRSMGAVTAAAPATASPLASPAGEFPPPLPLSPDAYAAPRSQRSRPQSSRGSSPPS